MRVEVQTPDFGTSQVQIVCKYTGKGIGMAINQGAKKACIQGVYRLFVQYSIVLFSGFTCRCIDLQG
jgi:hypothetical protein